MVWDCHWRGWCSGNRVGWQRPPLDSRFRLPWPLQRISTPIIHTIRGSWSDLLQLLLFGSGVIVGDLDPNLARVFALATQVVPQIILPSTWDHNLLEVDPCLSNQVRLLVIVENRDLQLVVVGGVVNGISKFLVPAQILAR